MTAGDRACPSSTVGHATHLLGVVGEDGRVHYVSPALPIDEDFRAKVGCDGRAEARFRFSGGCVEGACAQWTGSGCGVIDGLLDEVDALDEPLDTKLRHCEIRRTCRWFAQRGPAACHVCPLVVTDTRELEPAP